MTPAIKLEQPVGTLLAMVGMVGIIIVTFLWATGAGIREWARRNDV